MKTHLSTFKGFIKRLKADIDLKTDVDKDELDVIEILEPSCNMNFVNRLIGIRKDGTIVTQQYDYDDESVMENSFSDIMSSIDKLTVLETVEKYLK